MSLSSFLCRPLGRALHLVILFSAYAVAALAVPVITQQPQATVGAAGTPFSLSIVATGSGPLSYQWRRDGFPISNGTGSILFVPQPSQSDSGYYDVLVNDGQGTLTSAAAHVRIGPTAYADLLTPQIESIVRLESDREGQILRLATLVDGSFYVVGSFSAAQGESRPGLARFRSDGTIDRSFVPPAFDGAITTMAVQSDGRVVVAGAFQRVNGEESNGLARLNTNGSLDSTFTVGVGFGAIPQSFQAMAIAPNGSIFVSGTFQTYQGQGISILAKITPAGALDRSFTPGRLTQAPNALALAPDGKIYGVGTHYEVGGVSKQNGVFRLLPDGAIDPTFDAGAGSATTSSMQLLRLADGRLLVSGFFTNFAGSGISRLVRLNENGTVDTSFNLQLDTNNYVAAIAQASGGEVVLGGLFSTPTLSGTLVRVRVDGTVDRSFTPPSLYRVDRIALAAGNRIVVGGDALFLTNGNEGWTSVALLESDGRRVTFDPAFRFPRSPQMLRAQTGGKILVGGTFSFWNGSASAPLVRLNADFSVDRTFTPNLQGIRSITHSTVQPDGKILIAAQGDTPNTSYTLRRLNVDGTQDATFRNVTLSRAAFRPPFVLPDGRIILIDLFSQPSGIAVFGTDGTPITNHGFVSSGGSNTIYMIGRSGNDKILVGGYFLNWSGQSAPGLVRLNLNGSLDPTFNVPATVLSSPRGFDSQEASAQSSGRIVLAATGPQGNTRPIFAGLGINGAADGTFSSRLPSLLDIIGYSVQADDRILVWGEYSARGAEPFVARLQANGAIDANFEIIGDPLYVDRESFHWTTAVTMDSGDIVAANWRGQLTRYMRLASPIITTQPVALTRQSGDSAVFSVGARGVGTLTYQWYFNGTPIAGATNATLTLPFALSINAGSYHVVVTSSTGASTSRTVALAIASAAGGPTRLTNLSVRANVGSAPLITGFSTSGNREILIRGVGPGLAQFGVPGTLPDPRIALFNGSTTIDQNDNWDGAVSLSTAASAVGAFPLLVASADAVLLKIVNGPHTVQLSTTGTTGVGLTEIYDTNPSGTSTNRLTNLSARYQVGTGANVLIAGFSIVGTGNKGLVIRGIGPGLAAFGVPGTLNDPQIAVFSGVNRAAENNDWGGSATLSAAFTAVGAFPLATTSRDAALIIALPAGSYTVQLSGVGSTTGEGLIEVYELP